MRILILNWRCPRNPKAGGAEILTFEMARRLAASGDEVEWFSASFPGAPAEEDLDGVHFVRAGRQYTVHWHAYRHYRGQLRRRFDLVIDEVNTFPFFTPLWADIPMLMLIYQLARDVWWYEAPFPLNAIGYLLEPLYLRIYRSQSVLTISKSTERGLRNLGLRGTIECMPVGIDQQQSPLPAKAAEPTFLYVGRLAPSKRVEDIVQAFHRFRQEIHQGQLWIIGEGNVKYTHRLRSLTRQLGLDDKVTVLGRVSAEEKYQRMARAHMLLMASVREGWGLAVSEANACGTPAVVYDVPGLRDSVLHGQTGLVVGASPSRLADGMVGLWRDPLLYKRLAERAECQAQELTFDRAAEFVQAVVSSRLNPRAAYG